MSDIVYDKSQPANLKELEKRVLEAVDTINIHKRDIIKKVILYFSSRIDICSEFKRLPI